MNKETDKGVTVYSCYSGTSGHLVNLYNPHFHEKLQRREGPLFEYPSLTPGVPKLLTCLFVLFPVSQIEGHDNTPFSWGILLSQGTKTLSTTHPLRTTVRCPALLLYALETHFTSHVASLLPF